MKQCRRLCAAVLLLCLMVPSTAMAAEPSAVQIQADMAAQAEAAAAQAEAAAAQEESLKAAAVQAEAALAAAQEAAAKATAEAAQAEAAKAAEAAQAEAAKAVAAQLADKAAKAQAALAAAVQTQTVAEQNAIALAEVAKIQQTEENVKAAAAAARIMVQAQLTTQELAAQATAAKAEADAAAAHIVAQQEAQKAAAAAQAKAEAEGDWAAVYAENVPVGTSTTSFRGSSANRINNIKVSAARLDRQVIMPGQTLSFGEAVLPRTTANGYKTAGAYSGGKTIQAIGGGICQVSSTLYNAVMNAGVTVVKRYPHSMPVHYLPLGQDATISGTAKDLKIRNDYDTPIYTQAVVNGNELTITIYVSAEALAGRTYRFWAENTGKKAATSYLTTYVNGVETGTVKVADSRYQ